VSPLSYPFETSFFLKLILFLLQCGLLLPQF
jgi:hypothetical protein